MRVRRSASIDQFKGEDAFEPDASAVQAVHRASGTRATRGSGDRHSDLGTSILRHESEMGHHPVLRLTIRLASRRLKTNSPTIRPHRNRSEPSVLENDRYVAQPNGASGEGPLEVRDHASGRNASGACRFTNTRYANSLEIVSTLAGG
jgi:hypothetical protein